MDRGAGRGSGRGGRGRGNFPRWRAWMYNKKRGKGTTSNDGGGGRGKKRKAESYSNSNSAGSEGSNPNSESGSHSPPPAKVKRTDVVQKIKMDVEHRFINLLPGYKLYYSTNPPQLPAVEKKVAVIEDLLISSGLQGKASQFEIIKDEYGTNSSRSGSAYYHVDLDVILEEELFGEAWPTFEQDLTDEPQEVIKLWSVTAHKVVYETLLSKDQENGDDSDSDVTYDPCVPKIQVGLLKSKPVMSMSIIKSSFAGKFVTIKGTVVRTGSPRIYCAKLTFCCKSCETEFCLVQQDGKYTPPTSCPSEECTNASLFEPLEDAPTTVVLQSRRIKIQDELCDLQRGSVPQSIECLLFDQLSDKCVSGEVITLSGIVKISPDTVSGRELSLSSFYVEVSALKLHNDSERTMGGNTFSFSDSDYYAVKSIHSRPDLFRFLVASFCPSIYGHELIKVGLLLCLFGGTTYDGTISNRSDINMLMVGDPGIGKSQMLKVISKVAPRAVYVCGSGSTTAGLTVTLVKEGDQYSLEAGALVLADRGVCCIDEFDKIPALHNALLEAMEQQCVSVTKSGVFRTLPARASVIAAANPVGGHYNPTKTVSENIKINHALLSRFDLIFIVLDTADQKFDQKLFEHKRNMKVARISGASSISSASGSSVGQFTAATATPIKADATKGAERIPLKDSLKPREGEVMDLLPHSLLRKYIAYAKQYVHPKISPEASDILQKYYFKMRNMHRGGDTTPVTSRQLQSLRRLTEARAKLELREEATAEDAMDILEIFEFSMPSPLSDDVHAVSALSESVLLNTSRSGSKKSLVSQAKSLASSLQRYAEKYSKKLFLVDEIKRVATEIGVGQNVDALINTLNTQGLLLNKGGRIYQLQSVDF